MFCTLKHSLSDESYTFETTTPPFSRKREGRLAKIACTNCRISKLKCSGEPHGCQRCLAKKTDCRYPSPPRGNSHKKSQSQSRGQTQTQASAQAQAQTPARAPVPTPPETPPFQPHSRPSSACMDTTADDDLTVMSNQETTYSNTLDDLDLSLGGFEVSDFTTPESIPGLLSDGEYMDPSDAMRPWHQPFTFTSDDITSPWDGTSEREDIIFSSNDSKTSTVPSSPDMCDSSCACFSQAVSTYEAIEVAVWGQNELWRNADDMLRYQKKALIECEELLECRRCTTQSAYTMLLLSMCRRILATLGDLCQGASWGSDTVTNLPEERKRRKHSVDDDGAEDGRGRGYGISIRNRQLDDDDEYLVLQSLLTARVARLGRLLSTLNRIVSEQNWPAHKAIIRELQTRLAGSSFVVEAIQRPGTG
ncbi:hypothetical protein F5X97DRAFT_230116 [Nemania serpens]|nr:hypothetical protein F5X97DRAFT_230116 [Nemania serpens]